jgi:hypothetical protein
VSTKIICASFYFEAAGLYEKIRTARGRLGLEPWDDPLEDVYHEFILQNQNHADNTEQSAELGALRLEAQRAEQKAREFEDQLRPTEA